MSWYNAPVSVPFGNPNYDVGMGGSHDMDLKEPLDTPITALRSGTVVGISAPPWGRQVDIQLDEPIGRVPYYSFLHLDAVNPGVHLGSRLNVGDLVGWSGGANVDPGGTAPTGAPHFLNPTYQSSQPQIGISLQYGPHYGSGKGWVNPISSYPELNPMPLLGGGPLATPLIANTAIPLPSTQSGGIQLPFNGGTISTSALYRGGFLVVGLLLLFMGLKHFMGPVPKISISVPAEPAPAVPTQTPEEKKAGERFLKRTAGQTVAPPPPGSYV